MKISVITTLTTLSLLVFYIFYQNAWAQGDKQKLETIDVTGEKSTPQLERAFNKQRLAFIKLYNTINTDPQYDVICKWQKTIGSQIARKTCEPRYIKLYRAQTIQTWSTGTGIDFNRLPNDDTLRFLTRNMRKDAYLHVAKLVETHPKLMDSFLKLDALHSRVLQRRGGFDG